MMTMQCFADFVLHLYCTLLAGCTGGRANPGGAVGSMGVTARATPRFWPGGRASVPCTQSCTLPHKGRTEGLASQNPVRCAPVSAKIDHMLKRWLCAAERGCLLPLLPALFLLYIVGDTGNMWAEAAKMTLLPRPVQSLHHGDGLRAGRKACKHFWGNV